MASFELSSDFAQELAVRREMKPFEDELGAINNKLVEMERKIQFVLSDTMADTEAPPEELVELRAARLRQKEVWESNHLKEHQRAFTREAFRQYMRTSQTYLRESSLH